MERPLPAPRQRKPPRKRARTTSEHDFGVGTAEQVKANRAGIQLVTTGIGFVAFGGAIWLLLLMFGLPPRRAAALPLAGVILLALGVAASLVSRNRKATNAALSGTKLLLWLIIGALGLLTLLAVAGSISGLELLGWLKTLLAWI